MTEIPVSTGKQNSAYRFTAFFYSLIMKHYVLFLFLAGMVFGSCTLQNGPNAHSRQSPPWYFSPSHKHFRYVGRIDTSDSLSYAFSYPATSISFRFKGEELRILFKDLAAADLDPAGNTVRNMFNVYMDQNDPVVLELNKTDTSYLLMKNLQDSVHSVRIIKRTESLVGKVEFKGILLDTQGVLLEPLSLPERKIECIGNSITCGYGIEAKDQLQKFSCETENVSLAFGTMVADYFNAQYHAIAYSGRGIAQNYDGSGINTVPEIWNRIFPDEQKPAWDHSLYVPDIAMINLGTNDFSSGVDTTFFRKSYAAFLVEVREQYPAATIVCILGPMLNNGYPENGLNMARSLITSAVNSKQQEGDDKLYFFEMSAQTGKFGYGADWHPSVAQQKYNSEELMQFIQKITGW